MTPTEDGGRPDQGITRSLPPSAPEGAGRPSTAAVADSGLFTFAALSEAVVPAASLGRAGATSGEWRPGDVLLDTYVVQGQLGQGGMGTVYRVHHRGWNVDLAVKTPLEALVQDERARTLFVREAEVWIDLGIHPNIVTCHFVREIGGLPRVFVEHLEGGDLRRWISSGGSQSWADVLRIAIDVCEGMAFAHRTRGLVHRDLKPGNVLLDREGTAKATDFGLAKVMGFTQESPRAVVGTPEYMAPEQWSSVGEVGPAADIYAFGVMLFEMVTGARPFQRKPGEPDLVLHAHHVGVTPPPVEAARPDTPPDVADLIRRCLAKAPTDRPASFEHINDALRRVHMGVVGSPYQAQRLDDVQLRADTLNNRALSFFDLGRSVDARKSWEEALRADPEHPESLFNFGLVRWRNGEETDDHLRTTLAAVAAKHRRPDLLRWLDLARGDIAAAVSTPPNEGAPERDDVAALVVARLAAGQCEVALRQLETAGAGVAEQGWVRRLRSLALLGLSRRDEAQALWGSVAFPADSPEAFSRRMALLAGGNVLWHEPHEVRHVCFSADGQRLWVLRERQLACLSARTMATEAVAELACFGPSKHVTVWQAATDRDGRRVFACTSDLRGAVTQLLCYNVADGCYCDPVNPKVPYKDVNKIVVHPDGDVALVLSRNDIGLWDAPRGKYSLRFVGHDDAVLDARFIPGSRDVMSAGKDGTLRWWGADGFERGRTTAAEGGAFIALDISGDGRQALTGGGDGIVRLWHLDSGVLSQERQWRGHEALIRSVAFVPGSPWVLSADKDGLLRQWSLAGPQCRRTIKTPLDQIWRLEVDSAGERVVVSNVSGAAAFDLSRAFLEPSFHLSRVRASRQIVLVQGEFLKRVADAERASAKGAHAQAHDLLRQAQALPGYQRSHEVAERLQQVGCFGLHERIRDSWVATAFKGHDGAVSGVIDLPQQGWLVSTGATDGCLSIWNRVGGSRIAALPPHGDGIVRLAVLRGDQPLALTGSKNHSARLWDLGRRECLGLYEGLGTIMGVFFVADPAVGVAVSAHGVVSILDLEIGEVEARVELTSVGLRAATMMPDGAHLLLCLGDGTLAIWRVGRHAGVASLGACVGAATRLVLTADGKCLVVAGRTPDARMIDLQSGLLIDRWPAARPSGQSGQPMAIDEGGLFCSLDDASHVRFRSLGDKRDLGVLQTPSAASTVALSGDGRWLVTGHADGRIRRWEIDWGWRFDATPTKQPSLLDAATLWTGEKRTRAARLRALDAESTRVREVRERFRAMRDAVMRNCEPRVGLTGGEDLDRALLALAQEYWDRTRSEDANDDYIRRALGAAEPEIRVAAVELLGLRASMGESEGLETLLQLEGATDDNYVRLAVITALDGVARSAAQ